MTVPMIRTEHILALLAALAGAARAEPVPDAGTPKHPFLRPGFEALMDAVTFHVSFDADSMLPDMAAGREYQPRIHLPRDKKLAGPQFEDGLIGRALVLGTGAAVYPREGNVLFGKRGAIALWVKPAEWKRPNGGNVVFAMTSNFTFYLQRQGPLRGKDNKVIRHEGIQYLAKASPQQKRFTHLGGGIWENGRWYLVVANWSWPRMELSINGGPFVASALPSAPSENGFGWPIVGASGAERGLLDEFMAFRRPLSHAEVRTLYTLLK